MTACDLLEPAPGQALLVEKGSARTLRAGDDGIRCLSVLWRSSRSPSSRIRFEERLLFPMIEEALPPDELERLAAAIERAESKHE